MGKIKYLRGESKMGVDIYAVLMIGHIFEEDEIDDYDDIENEELDFSGDHMGGSYMCVGHILAETDSYGATSYKPIEDLDYDFIRDKIEMKLKKIYPNKELDVKMYLVTDIG